MKIFLDDYRHPFDAFRITNNEIYLFNDWKVVKNFNEFKKLIKSTDWSEIKVISFDHDLSDEHYLLNNLSEVEYDIAYKKMQEKTGLHCAEYLVERCKELGLNLPKYFCHSLNPIGKSRILRTLDSYHFDL